MVGVATAVFVHDVQEPVPVHRQPFVLLVRHRQRVARVGDRQRAKDIAAAIDIKDLPVFLAPEPLDAMLRACVEACLPEWTESEAELLELDFGGLCYTAAMRWITVVEDADWVVVHGTVLSARVGKRIAHAWCERGEVVVDLAMPIGSRKIERKQYYRVVKPEVIKVYPSDDALLLSVKNGHDGPWDESEQLK